MNFPTDSEAGGSSVAHGVSRGYLSVKKPAATAAKLDREVFRRAAAQAGFSTQSHGLRHGLQIFCRSAAERDFIRRIESLALRLGFRISGSWRSR